MMSHDMCNIMIVKQFFSGINNLNKCMVGVVSQNTPKHFILVVLIIHLDLFFLLINSFKTIT